ncbi:uncharacterized protein PAC_03578 [Phialocephala subalpina]|uniref:Uncharacterized protein n=1 Tax=Phialocephala subalpina TaxID=576137 RepID=A0A1L7WLQ8_9HELO|nr:uncharacterized protein PAC_03578 [Phialocephala subalpina]
MAPTKPDPVTPVKTSSGRAARRNAAGMLYHQSSDKVEKVVRQKDLAVKIRYPPKEARKNPPPEKFQGNYSHRPIEYEEAEPDNPLSGNRLALVDDGEEYENDEDLEDEEYEEEKVVAAGLASVRKPRLKYAPIDPADKGKFFLNENGVLIRCDEKQPWKPTAHNDMSMARTRYPPKGPNENSNGRYMGRHLVNWHRPRMMEKLLLCIQYECHRDGLLIPWDKIVHRLNPGSSGPSACQMLCKLREVLISEGHFIPPSLGKQVMKIDPLVRGYTRDLDKAEPWAAKIVYWTDEVDHPTESRTDTNIIRGSGKYRLATADQVDKVNEARERIEGPDALPAYSSASRNSSRANGSTPVKSRSQMRNSAQKPSLSRKFVDDEEIEEVAPEENDLDSDYNPEVTKRRSRRSGVRPSRTRRPAVVEKFVDESDDEFEPLPRRRRSLIAKLPVPAISSSPQKPSTAPSKFAGLSYRGPEEHGSIQQFSDAVKDGMDPSLNGSRHQSRGASMEHSISIGDGTDPEVVTTAPTTPGNANLGVENAASGTPFTSGGVSRLQLDSPTTYTSPNPMYPLDMNAPMSSHLASNLSYVGLAGNYGPSMDFGAPSSFGRTSGLLGHAVFGGSASGVGNQSARPFSPPGVANGYGNGFNHRNQGISMFTPPKPTSKSPSTNGLSQDIGDFSQSTGGISESTAGLSQDSSAFNVGSGSFPRGNNTFHQSNAAAFEHNQSRASDFLGHDSQSYGFGGYQQDQTPDFNHSSHFDDAVNDEKHGPSSPGDHGSPFEYTEY